MKNVMICSIFMMVAICASVQAAEPTSITVECNWGTLTMEAIAGGFPQGEHSADPSGDGKPGDGDDADSPRVGIANVINQGSLQETCEFIASQL